MTGTLALGLRALLAVSLIGASLTANPAAAQSGAKQYPKLSTADLAPCRSEISALQAEVVQSLRGMASREPNDENGNRNRQHYNQRASDVAGKDPLTLYYEGFLQDGEGIGGTTTMNDAFEGPRAYEIYQERLDYTPGNDGFDRLEWSIYRDQTAAAADKCVARAYMTKFAALNSKVAVDQPSQTFSIGGSPTPPGSAGGPYQTGNRVETRLKSGDVLPGSTNLACVVFVPGEGPDARSALVNNCGEEVRLNYCLQYLQGADNCWPMSTGSEATLWPVRAGASLTMPAAETLKLWSVFACRAPTFPLWVKFKGGMLTDGLCPEDLLAPPPPGPGETPRIVRSDDISTWPPAWANKKCLRLNPRLDRGTTSIMNTCATDQNIYVCIVPNGSRQGLMPCMDRPLATVIASTPPNFGQPIGAPSTYRSVHAFACDAPAQPTDVRWDGNELTGTCKAP